MQIKQTVCKAKNMNAIVVFSKFSKIAFTLFPIIGAKSSMLMNQIIIFVESDQHLMKLIIR
ncbi:hypothetical protein BpHYR1_022460 [Brachionus plicatilis]|uniref:Uncharacterized protein n=1 Tax=Brachionus plicatilis TaxID=10195 RepID=A0A3M7R0C9_BRAPC|nr:hypothetical protein BpHYR1_022460 [Brachionus plicatilis]